MLREIEDLQNHKIVDETSKALVPRLIKNEPIMLKILSGKKPTEKEIRSVDKYPEYDYEIFKYAMNLIEILIHLKEVGIFISSFPRPKTYQKRGITQNKWIIYHYSNYISSVLSLFDISLILTDKVFRLGNPERECKRHIILKNLWVQKSIFVKDALEDIDRTIEKYRAPRNLYLHRGFHPSPFDDFFGPFMEIASYLEQIGNPAIHADILHHVYTWEGKRIKAQIDEEVKIYCSLIRKLFDSLYDKYKK